MNYKEYVNHACGSHSWADTKRQSVHRWDEFLTPQKSEPTLRVGFFVGPVKPQ